MQGRLRDRFIPWAAVGAFAVASVFVWRAARPSVPAEQPIRFNHALHAGNNVACVVCHPYFRTSAEAGLPGVATCRRCHEDVVQVSPEKRKLQAYAESGREIPWRRVYDLPEHVYFSHRRHVVFGAIQCSECHGDVAGQREPLTQPLVPLQMEACIGCHTRQQAHTALADVNECTRCHQ